MTKGRSDYKRWKDERNVKHDCDASPYYSSSSQAVSSLPEIEHAKQGKKLRFKEALSVTWRMLNNGSTGEDIQRLAGAPQEGYMFSVIRKFSIGGTLGATLAGQNLYMSPSQGRSFFTAEKDRKSMTKNQRKACRYGLSKEETAKKILRAKFVQDGWYLRGVREDETVTKIIEEHTGMVKKADSCGVHACLDVLFSCHLSSGRVLRHSFEIKAPYWNATYKDAPFPLAVGGAMPGNVTQTWRPYPTQYGAQAAIGGLAF